MRKHLIFGGYVQGVGFRFEVMCLAERLGLTGWVKNLADGRVEAEMQGNEEKIAFVVKYMRSLPRMSVESVEENILPPVPEEQGFTVKM